MTPPMRLLLVTDSYPPLIGGADLQTQMLAHAMRDAGHEVAVVTGWQPGLAELDDDAGVTVRRVRALTTRVPWFSGDPGHRHHPPFPDPGAILPIRRLVRDRRVELVHSYGWITYSAAAALIGTRVPLLVTARDYGYVCGVRNYLYYRGTVCSGPAPLKCLRCASATYAQEAAGNAVLGAGGARVGLADRLRGAAKGIVAAGGTFLGRPILRHRPWALHSNSQFVQGVMDRHLVGPRATAAPVLDVVIPSFLPAREAGTPDAAFLDRLPSEPFLLFVGALLPEKGIWPLLDAYQRLRPPAPPLVLIGPTTAKAPTDYPPGVRFLGPTSHATVMAAWDRALLGVVPSVGAETFGNVATEAMSRGRAVVASRLGGLVDIIVDGDSGLLVPPGDPSALATAIQHLVDDPAERDRLGAAARVRVERFTASQVLPRFAALYANVLEAARGGASTRSSSKVGR